MKKLRLSLRGLKRRDLRILRRQHQKWRKVIQPHLDAIEESTRITAADLATRVCCEPRRAEGD